MSPEKDRIKAGSSTDSNPAIALLRKTLASGGDAEAGFREWRRNPFTRAFVNALAEFVDSPPPATQIVGPDGVLVQYGVTAGLALALKLLTQPNRVFPEVFRGDVSLDEFPSALDDAYVDSQDSVIDRM